MSSDMSKEVHGQENSIFILDERIKFSVLEAVLQEDNQHHEVHLQRPASKCLALLINRHGNLVSQDELISYGWGEEKARFISPNTFYQSMHHLRQSLTQVGLPDVIHTVARKGTVLSSALSIRIIQHDKVELKPGDSTRRFYPFFFLSICIVAISITALFLLWMNTQKDANNIFHKYAHNTQLKCQIYRYPHSLGDIQVNLLLTHAGISCNEPQTVILTSTGYGERNSIINCSETSANFKSCRIYYIMDSLNEK